MLKVNNRNTRTRCEICSKLKIKIPERKKKNMLINKKINKLINKIISNIRILECQLLLRKNGVLKKVCLQGTSTHSGTIEF